MQSRLVEPRRACRATLGALALGLGGALQLAAAQDAGLGLRGGSLADAAPSLAAPAPLAAPDAAGAAPPIAPPVDLGSDDKAKADAKAKAKAAARRKLPPLAPYPGAQRLGLRGGQPDAQTNAPSPTIAALPALQRRKPTPDDKPFDPVGVRIGDLKLTPYVEEDFGWASNPDQTSGPRRSSAFDATEVGASLQSDWSRSELRGTLKGAYTDYFNDSAANAPTASGALDGRYDASRDLSFDAEGRFDLSQQTQTSLGLGGQSGSTKHPLVSVYGATLGGAQRFGDFTFGLHATLDRTIYESISGLDLASDDYNDWGLRGRIAYRLSEAVSPFVELDADARRYDSPIDYTGYNRKSDGWGAIAGATLAFTRQLSGEASVGYGARAYEDPRLRDFGGPLVDASLIWSATPLTTVTAKAQTTLADSVAAGASGALQRSASLDVAHDLTRALTFGTTTSWKNQVYKGVSQNDTTTTYGARLEYHVSRELVLKASASRELYQSNLPNSNYVADVFMLGLKLQR